MHGLHLTADLRGCDRTRATLTDPARLRAACLSAVEEAGLNAVAELFHRFQTPAGSAQPSGVTGVVLLAESHLAVHTWPELGVVTLDVYVCNLGQDHSAQAEALLARLMAEFAPRESETQRLMRGA